METLGEPGSAKFGNFINYYTFNPPERRLQLIPSDLLERSCLLLREKRDLLALDVGCNSGNLTLAVYDHLTKFQQCEEQQKSSSHHITINCQPLNILGVDRDPILIERCMEHKRHVDEVLFRTCDMTSADSRHDVIDGYLRQRQANRFDIVFLFSVTMWIHLNHGDAGLRDFLSYVSSVATYVVVEAQSWKSYTSAVRRMKKVSSRGDVFENYRTLEWRENVEKEIISYLQGPDCKMCLLETFGRTDWNRAIHLFVRDVAIKGNVDNDTIYQHRDQNFVNESCRI